MGVTGDVVIIHINNKPSVYARIESIEPDIKPNWYQVKFLFLSFPPQEMTWILRKEYLEGSSFTMKDIPIQIKPLDKPEQQKPYPRSKSGRQGGEVISINQIRTGKDKKIIPDKT
ncbi:MAG TPA: hypothetical protein VMU10_06795 [Desulfomonilia bacterium]|nr:hypothetical protein [Desulfomonilia bacterium]